MTNYYRKKNHWAT